jgi:hypothetical protein
MTNSFWFGGGGEVVDVPAVEPPYNVEDSSTADNTTRTFKTTDGVKKGETGEITNVVYNIDNTQTLTVSDGFEPYQALIGNYLQVGDIVTQDAVGNLNTSQITSVDFYNIKDSVLFTTGGYLTRTVSTSNSNTYTVSCWVKRSKLGVICYLFGCDGDKGFGFAVDNKFITYTPGSTTNTLSGSTFSDTSRWYHVVVSANAGTATVYIDAKTVGTAPAPDYMNSCVVGSYNSGGALSFNGYIADFQLIDNQSLTPSSFGEFTTAGFWQPKNYTGTYGTKGFHLDFFGSDLGNDVSGQGNNWTERGIIGSVPGVETSAIVNETQYVESSTISVGSPMQNFSYKLTEDVSEVRTPLTNSILQQIIAIPGYTAENPKQDSFKRAPYIYITGGGQKMRFNFSGADINTTYQLQTSAGTGARAYTYRLTGDVTPTNGSEIQSGVVADDSPLKDVCTFNVTQTSGYYEIEVGSTSGNLMVHFMSIGAPYSESVLTFATPNPDLQYFEAGDQVGTVSGFKPVIWTGGPNIDFIACGFDPDLVWIKPRTLSDNHNLYDTIRGDNVRLCSNTFTAGQNVSFQFKTGGFNPVAQNDNGQDYVAWAWDAGDTTVTNNDGTIKNVQVRSNGNFSVIKYTGAAGGTIGHGLSSPPSLIITKSTSNALGWPVYAKSLGKDKYLTLSGPNEAQTASNVWGTSEPTDTVFGVDTNADSGNNSGDMIAYAWAETPGVSNFGTYTGMGQSGAAPVVNCGFQPAFVLIKDTTNGNNWVVADNARGDDYYLFPNLPDTEYQDDWLDFTSTGFKINTTNVQVNASGETFIYAAFAGPNPVEVVDVDVVANTMTVDSGPWAIGDTVSKDAVIGQDYKDSPVTAGTETGLGDEITGNYATLDPTDGSPTLSNGNLTATGADAYPTIIPGSGNWYYEVDGTGYTWNGTRANWTPRAGVHNFGQKPFVTQAPAGSKSLCSTNL